MDTDFQDVDVNQNVENKIVAHGSPITKSSPALIDGINPNEPTSAAAASLTKSKVKC